MVTNNVNINLIHFKNAIIIKSIFLEKRQVPKTILSNGKDRSLIFSLQESYRG